MIYFLNQFKNHENLSKADYQKQILSSFVDSVIINEKSMIIAYKYSGENDITEVVLPDFMTLKNSFGLSVRMSSKWWRIGDSNS